MIATARRPDQVEPATLLSSPADDRRHGDIIDHIAVTAGHVGHGLHHPQQSRTSSDSTSPGRDQANYPSDAATCCE